MMDKDFFVGNRKKIIESLKENSVVIVYSGALSWMSKDVQYVFNVNKNFYYLTGIEQPNTILVMIKEKDYVYEKVFIEKGDKLYHISQDITVNFDKFVGKGLTNNEVENLSGINDIYNINDFVSWVTDMVNEKKYSYVYFDFDINENKLENTFIDIIKDTIKYSTQFLHINNLYNKIDFNRQIKSEIEVDNIKQAIEITDKGIKNVLDNIKPDMYEYQIEALFDFAIKNCGVKKYAFNPTFASGDNAIYLHYDKNSSVAKRDCLILIDVGAQYNNYCSDISRTVPVNGKFSDRQKEFYNIVLDTQKKVIANIKPGIGMLDLYDISKRTLIEHCKKVNLIKDDEEILKYYYHKVSHHLGLDAHDSKERDTILAPGMVITVEPGLYIEEEGIGIRIEDDILVTEDGYINLSENIPKEIEDIERIMEKERIG